MAIIITDTVIYANISNLSRGVNRRLVCNYIFISVVPVVGCIRNLITPGRCICRIIHAKLRPGLRDGTDRCVAIHHGNRDAGAGIGHNIRRVIVVGYRRSRDALQLLLINRDRPGNGLGVAITRSSARMLPEGIIIDLVADICGHRYFRIPVSLDLYSVSRLRNGSLSGNII